MSELPLAEQDGQSEDNAPDSQREAHETCDKFFRFRPVAYFKHLARQVDQHKEPQNKTANYANLACNACGEFYDGVGIMRLTLGAIIIAVGVGLWLLWTDRLGSSGVVAIFTIILTFATWYSWQAMRHQNNIMLRQMRQTKAIIEHM